jgi:hypothetical protein
MEVSVLSEKQRMLPAMAAGPSSWMLLPAAAVDPRHDIRERDSILYRIVTCATEPNVRPRRTV